MLIVRKFGLCAYDEAYAAMVELNTSRDATTPDEIWFMQHPPVYTLGMAGKTLHVLDPGRIPVIKTDRGGQVTYHGPGQLLGYLMLDLKRIKLNVRALVQRIEQAIINMLAQQGISAGRRPGAPGVYVDGCKVAALGIRVRNGCSYHGFSLNVNMDLGPFQGINPCGYAGLQVTQLRDLDCAIDVDDCAGLLLPHLCTELGYDQYEVTEHTGTASPGMRQPA